jgi:pyochelin biosynthetic protein PchC
VRLVCFPHAGGGASAYANWAHPLRARADVLVVQYPGREERFGEPIMADLAELAELAYQALIPELDRDVVLFGHSMGSAVAYEVARRVEAEHPGRLARLVVSGRPAPHRLPPGRKHLLPEEEFVAHLRALGGTDDAMLDSADFRAVFLPLIRGDYRMIESYRPAAGASLSAPVSAFHGSADPQVDPAGMRAWAELTGGDFRSTEFPGGHFYLMTEKEAVQAAIAKLLDSV